MLQAVEFEGKTYGGRFWVVVEDCEVDRLIALHARLGYGLSDVDNVVYGPHRSQVQEPESFGRCDECEHPEHEWKASASHMVTCSRYPLPV